MLIWVLCLSLTYSTLWHHYSGVRARLHGAVLETANLHRRCWHHRLLRWLPWGHRWCAGEVAWGQHQGCQREGLQGELMRTHLHPGVLISWQMYEGGCVFLSLCPGVWPARKQEVPVPGASSQHGRCWHPITAQQHLPVRGVDHCSTRLVGPPEVRLFSQIETSNNEKGTKHTSHSHCSIVFFFFLNWCTENVPNYVGNCSKHDSNVLGKKRDCTLISEFYNICLTKITVKPQIFRFLKRHVCFHRTSSRSAD